MNEINIKVNNCGDCPFSSTDMNDGMGFCGFPNEDDFFYLSFKKDEPAPEECPLRKCAITISLNND